MIVEPLTACGLTVCVNPAVLSRLTSDHFRCWSRRLHAAAAALWTTAGWARGSLLSAGTETNLAPPAIHILLSSETLRTDESRVESNQNDVLLPKNGCSTQHICPADTFPTLREAVDSFRDAFACCARFWLESHIRAFQVARPFLLSQTSRHLSLLLLQIGFLVHLETHTRSLILHFSALLCVSVTENIWMYFPQQRFVALWFCDTCLTYAPMREKKFKYFAF